MSNLKVVRFLFHHISGSPSVISCQIALQQQTTFTSRWLMITKAHSSLRLGISCGLAVALLCVLSMPGPRWKGSYCLKHATLVAERKYHPGNILAFKAPVCHAHMLLAKASHTDNLMSMDERLIMEGLSGMGLVERVVRIFNK